LTRTVTILLNRVGNGSPGHRLPSNQVTRSSGHQVTGSLRVPVIGQRITRSPDHRSAGHWVTLITPNLKGLRVSKRLTVDSGYGLKPYSKSPLPTLLLTRD